jgi:hypothetical protein
MKTDIFLLLHMIIMTVVLACSLNTINFADMDTNGISAIKLIRFFGVLVISIMFCYLQGSNIKYFSEVD